MCDVLPDESGIVLTSRELEEKISVKLVNNQNHFRHCEHNVESNVPKLHFPKFLW
jgi:hypothetical protein